MSLRGVGYTSVTSDSVITKRLAGLMGRVGCCSVTRCNHSSIAGLMRRVGFCSVSVITKAIADRLMWIVRYCSVSVITKAIADRLMWIVRYCSVSVTTKGWARLMWRGACVNTKEITGLMQGVGCSSVTVLM